MHIGCTLSKVRRLVLGTCVFSRLMRDSNACVLQTLYSGKERYIYEYQTIHHTPLARAAYPFSQVILTKSEKKKKTASTSSQEIWFKDP